MHPLQDHPSIKRILKAAQQLDAELCQAQDDTGSALALHWDKGLHIVTLSAEQPSEGQPRVSRVLSVAIAAVWDASSEP